LSADLNCSREVPSIITAKDRNCGVIKSQWIRPLRMRKFLFMGEHRREACGLELHTSKFLALAKNLTGSFVVSGEVNVFT
jgi:hypothetical protein